MEYQKVPYGGIMDAESAKSIANQLFQMYDLNQNGIIEINEVVPMMIDCYRAMNKVLQPSSADVQTYARILDFNSDGKINLQDIEQLAYKYLVGDSQQIQLSNLQSDIQKSQRKEQTKKAGHGGVKKQYSKAVEARLEVARRLFKQFDRDQNGLLDEPEILELIQETYRQIGINYKATHEDVKQWLDMGDKDMNGTVDLPEYEELVIRSLEKAGIQLFD